MKKILIISITLFIISCAKDTPILPDEEITVYARGNVTICHQTNSNNNPWATISVNENAVSGHLAHGDIHPDSDGDGFTSENPCGIGDQTDCDDNDASVYPGAVELCGDGVDNNCNGEVDENCCCFDGLLQPIENIILVDYLPQIGYGRVLYNDGLVITLGFPGCGVDQQPICYVCVLGEEVCNCDTYAATPPLPQEQFDECLAVIAEIYNEVHGDGSGFTSSTNKDYLGGETDFLFDINLGDNE